MKYPRVKTIRSANLKIIPHRDNSNNFLALHMLSLVKRILEFKLALVQSQTGLVTENLKEVNANIDSLMRNAPNALGTLNQTGIAPPVQSSIVAKKLKY